MKITVVGCGKIGSTILANLVSEGHDVVVIDNDPAVIEEMTNIYDVMGVCGNGVDCDTLIEAGAEKSDLLIAATGSDEFNMLSCFAANRLGVGHTIAKISNPEYNDKSLGFMQKQLGLSLAVNPELLTAREIYNVLKVPSAAKIETFSGGSFEIVELILKPDSPLDGLTLIELRKKYHASFLVCVVQRDDKIYIPDGNFTLKSGDRIALTATPSEIYKLMKMLGLMQKMAKNVMMLGASKTAFYLSKLLLASGASVKIVELDKGKCEEFCDKLGGISMIHGDGAHQELLLEEGLPSMDAFITLTGSDEENILLSYFASSQNVPKVISKVNRNEFVPIAERLGLDCIVSPRRSVSDVVVRYARALQNSEGSNVETLYKLMDGRAEALEFIVRPDLDLLGKPLKELDLKPGLLVAGISRARKTIIPSGDDVILAGDKVIVIAAGQRLGDLADIVR
ncbi:MAG: Trk system potassium transporter TrkA [Ruminococcaceae bacterium]|nr:Trk system potassium transporter TrkA [Oscillospiraceae bacterium]